MPDMPEEALGGASELQYGGAEWEVAFSAYRAAQARTATAGAYLVLNEWQALVNPASMGSSAAGAFMDYLVRVIRAFRTRQLTLARSYLQYIAALEIEAPGGEPLFGGDPGRLSTYRDTFLEGVMDAANLGRDQVSYWPTDADWDFVLSELRQLDHEGSSSNLKAIPLSDIDLDRHLEELEKAFEPDKEVSPVEFYWPEEDGDNDDAHRDYFETLIKDLEEELRRDQAKEDLLDREEGNQERREREAQQLEELSRTKGNKLAGQVMSATSDAADQVTEWAMKTDRRVRMVARGTSATPCTFCAMLASRGFAYASVASAATTSSGSGLFKRYHPNCQCYPIVRYVDADELPALNQLFKDMWESSRGKGQSTLKTFRKALYELNRDAINARRRRLYHERKAHAGIDAH